MYFEYESSYEYSTTRFHTHCPTLGGQLYCVCDLRSGGPTTAGRAGVLARSLLSSLCAVPLFQSFTRHYKFLIYIHIYYYYYVFIINSANVYIYIYITFIRILVHNL